MYYTQTIDQFNSIAHKLMIIFGILMCLLGSIGNLLNICIFTIWSRSPKRSTKYSSNHRTNNSPLYLLASSLANLILILYPFLTRIMFDGYEYQITRTHVFLLCKLRYYSLHTFYLISLTCICMATFDRYLISSRNVHLRELSTTKQRTIIIILILSSLIALHNLPLMIFFNISNTDHCSIISTTYAYYYLYVYRILLQGILPILFLSIFGLLTLKQLKLIHQHNSSCHLNSDRQLARMLLLMSITIILSSIPNCIEQIYDLIFTKEHYEHSSRFFLYHVISSILFYTNPVTSFYIFYISTPNFRLQLRNLCKRDDEDLVHHQIIHSKILTPN